MHDHNIEKMAANIFVALSGMVKEDSFRSMFEDLKVCIVAERNGEALAGNPQAALFQARVLAPFSRLGHGQCVPVGLRVFEKLVDTALRNEVAAAP